MPALLSLTGVYNCDCQLTLAMGKVGRVYYFILFSFGWGSCCCFDTGSHCVALASLEQ